MSAPEPEAGEALAAYTMVVRERDGARFWIRCGSAVRNRDGSINITLDSIPTNGTIHVRPLKRVPGEA